MMPRFGFKRDAEIDAICDYCAWLVMATRAHSNDAELIAFNRRCHLIALSEIMKDTEASGEEIVRSRSVDCAECIAEFGRRPCSPSHCKYRDKKLKKDHVKKYFGERAIHFLEKYKEIKTKGRKCE